MGTRASSAPCDMSKPVAWASYFRGFPLVGCLVLRLGIAGGAGSGSGVESLSGMLEFSRAQSLACGERGGGMREWGEGGVHCPKRMSISSSSWCFYL